jgi:hypothetical protein
MGWFGNLFSFRKYLLLDYYEKAVVQLTEQIETCPEGEYRQELLEQLHFYREKLQRYIYKVYGPLDDRSNS